MAIKHIEYIEIPNKHKDIVPTPAAQTNIDVLRCSTVSVDAMPTGDLGTITVTKTINEHTATITPNLSAGTAGYNEHNAMSGDAIEVNANELVSGSISIIPNLDIQSKDITNYATVKINSIYQEINSSENMDLVKNYSNLGNMYKYTGVTTANYTNGRFYIVEDEISNPLCFTANTANSTIELRKYGWPSWTGSYSIDEVNWITYEPNTTGVITLANVGDKVYFKGDIAANFTSSNYLYFCMSGSIAASGNCNSMYVSNNFANLTTLTYEFCFCSLFSNCGALTSAPMLPATTLSRNCYAAMFYGCTSLLNTPSLPATNLAISCYLNMFAMCKSLTTAPCLPATVLFPTCYKYMFDCCSSLINVPALPATTLAEGCYFNMFSNCTSLNTLPKLPATELAASCYEKMFYECRSLQVSDTQTEAAAYIWSLPTNDSFANTYAQASMFVRCAGSRSSSTMAGEAGHQYVYYTQNKPI